MKSKKKIVIIVVCILAVIALAVAFLLLRNGKSSEGGIPLDIQLGKTTTGDLAGKVTINDSDECDYVLNNVKGLLHFTKEGSVITAVTFVCSSEDKAGLVEYLGKTYGEKEDLYGYLEWSQDGIAISYLNIGEEAIAEWRLSK